MNNIWLNKCKNIDNGLKKTTPNEDISNNYLKQAENTLKIIKKIINEEDFLWASVMIYYCAYYSLYAFLQKIGIKSENHSCSITFFNYLTEKENLIKNINKFKTARIDSQYYLNISDKKDLEENYKLLKEFYIELYNLCNTNNEGLLEYINKANHFFIKEKINL